MSSTRRVWHIARLHESRSFSSGPGRPSLDPPAQSLVTPCSASTLLVGARTANRFWHVPDCAATAKHHRPQCVSVQPGCAPFFGSMGRQFRICLEVRTPFPARLDLLPSERDGPCLQPELNAPASAAVDRVFHEVEPPWPRDRRGPTVAGNSAMPALCTSSLGPGSHQRRAGARRGQPSPSFVVRELSPAGDRRSVCARPAGLQAHQRLRWRCAACRL